MKLSEYGRRFLHLALHIDKHNKGYVDFYIGPKKLRKIVDNEVITSPNKLLTDCKALQKDLFKQGYDKKRERYLEKMLTAMRTSIEIINGAKILRAQEVDGPSLASLATALHNQGARNINYVGGDPTPHLHTILNSMKFLKENVCQLWNSNLYLSENALWLLMDVIDVWLPDLKYGNNDCGQKYSGISQYWDILTRNLTLLYNHGSKNIIIRHLVMPGHIECCTKPLLSWIAREIPHVVINIMGQYHPDYKVSADNFPEINRRVTSAEMKSAYDYADQLNLEYRSVS